MSTKAAQVTTLFLFTYANRLLITCAFRFQVADLIYLFSYLDCAPPLGAQNLTISWSFWDLIMAKSYVGAPPGELAPPPRGNPRSATGFNIHYLFVYWFKVMSTKAGGRDHLFLFTYGNRFLITCGFCFNIHYLFVYLFKAMSTKAAWKSTTCFYLLMVNWLLITCVFRFNINYLFLYLFKAMSTKAGGSRPPVFIYLWKSLLVDYMWFSFEYSVSIYLFIQSDVNKSSWKPPDDLYLLMEITSCDKWFSF